MVNLSAVILTIILGCIFLPFVPDLIGATKQWFRDCWEAIKS